MIEQILCLLVLIICLVYGLALLSWLVMKLDIEKRRSKRTKFFERIGGNLMDKKDLAELTPEEKEKPVTWGELVEVAKMIGEEAIKLIERSDTEKNALGEVVEMIIDSMNTRFAFMLQLMCHAHRWDCSEMLQAYDHFMRQMENKEEP